MSRLFALLVACVFSLGAASAFAADAKKEEPKKADAKKEEPKKDAAPKKKKESC